MEIRIVGYAEQLLSGVACCAQGCARPPRGLHFEFDLGIKPIEHYLFPVVDVSVTEAIPYQWASP